MGLLSVPLDSDTEGTCHISACVGTGRTTILGRPQQLQPVLPTVCQPQPDAITKFDNPGTNLVSLLGHFWWEGWDRVGISVFLYCLPTVESTHNLWGWFLSLLSKNVGCELISYEGTARPGESGH